ncbi:MAG: hypothetical protein AAB731_02280, partial [Patescibacteria group bacterium]
PRLFPVVGCAGGLGVKHSALANEVKRIAKKTGGKEISVSRERLSSFIEKFPRLKLSEESLSSFAAGFDFGNASDTLVISTGKLWT